MKQVILTESQFNTLIESQIILEGIFSTNSIKKIKSYIEALLYAGVSIATIYIWVKDFCDTNHLPEETKAKVLSIVEELPQNNRMEVQPVETLKKTEVKKDINPLLKDWKLADDKTIATVYNAIPAQCNGDFGHTASMFRLNLYDVLSQRVIAMERTFMKKLGLNYGDVVYIEGTGKYDGVWQIQDTMNKRFAGQNKIDILVPDNVKYGQWDNIKIYTLKDKNMTNSYRSKMAPQVSKQELARQVKAKKNEYAKKKAQKKLAKK
jgi:hypothetical protein